MRRKHTGSACTMALVVTGCCLSSVAPASDALETAAAIVTVAPHETDEVLANPGVGWQTFGRTADQDRRLPSWIPSTVQYARWSWSRVEPEEGKIDHNFLEGALAQTRKAGQALGFRIMCVSPSSGRPYHPAWLKEAGGRILKTRSDNGPLLDVPDLDDPAVLEHHLDFIERLGRRYDGHADVDHVDLGSVGWWGEWHMSGSSDVKMPTLATRKKIVDAYFEAFEKTPLVMLVGGREMLKYATARGAGWRADCLGDMDGFPARWSHMGVGYPEWLKEGDALNAWKTAPVAWETCWDMRKWVGEGWSVRFIFNYALALHGSQINNKSAPLPEGENVRPEIERFLRRLGYRLVLKELNHPDRATPGSDLELSMKWQNVGSAPCYRRYRLAYRLAGQEGGDTVLLGDVTVNRWMPGSIDVFDEEFFKGPKDLPPGEVVEVADKVALPKDLVPGDYILSIGVVGEKTTKPIVRLGIKGRDRDGWYPVSKICVSH